MGIKTLSIYIEKQFDCVKFKNELQKNLLEKSGAHNLREYVIYANKIAEKSLLHKPNRNIA
jgi:hypothetical protein